MKQKKKTFSLTSKQRKEQKRNLEKKNMTFEQLPEEEQSAILLKKENKKAKKKKILTIVSLVLVVVIAVGLIGGGTYLLIKDSIINNDEINPTAIITLNNDEKLEIDLLYKDNKAAVANFIYLALGGDVKNGTDSSGKGFFDDTMFNNTLGGFVMMSGFTSPTQHRAQSIDYVASLKGFTSSLSNSYGNSNFKLGYRITKLGSTPYNKRGYFAFMSGASSTLSSSTSFMFITDNNAQLRIEGSYFDTSYTSYIGLMNEETMQVLDRITAIPTQECNYVSNFGYPNPEENSHLRIKSIKIKNLNSKLRKNIMNNFEQFVLSGTSEMEGALKGQSGTYFRSTQDGYFNKTT